MPDLALAYAETRRSMAALARELDEKTLATSVPACPAWTIKDLVGHVTGIASQFAYGRFEPGFNPAMMWDPGVAERRDDLIDREIAARRSMGLEEILAEWDKSAVSIEAMIRGEIPWPEATPPFGDWVVVTDCAVHHHDLRGAAGRPGERDSLATGLSLRSYVEAMRMRAQIEGMPVLRIRAGSREWVVGDGEPAATVGADTFELARAASGRRSPGQIRAYAWEGDPEPFLPLFYPYGLRTEALIE